MESLPVLSIEMVLVLALLAFAIFLFVTEMLRVDVTALLIMTLLGLMITIPGLDGLVRPDVLFAGFSSNAVMSIIAVMIIGGGLDKTGVMEQVASFILRIGGATEKRTVSLVSTTVGVTSSFMQNVGATALFMPVVARISARAGYPLSRLLMPMGFCAILGGTITMVGSSPLIMLNDLLRSASDAGIEGLHTFGLFSVAPVGLALVFSGLAYFLIFGRYILPPVEQEATATRGAGTLEYLRRVYGIDAWVHEVFVPRSSPLVGQDIQHIQEYYEVRVVASRYGGRTLVCPPMEAPIAAPAALAVVAEPDNLERFVEEGGLRMRSQLRSFRQTLGRQTAGIAEIVIPPDSGVDGQSVRELRLRATYGLSLISLYRGGETINSKLQDLKFQAGDTLVCHTRWEDLERLERNRDFVVVTSEYPRERARPQKVAMALMFFALAIFLVMFTDLVLPVALLTGAVGMVISGVLTMDEAYRAVSWKTVFLLAGLLPLGFAVESSGAANYIAQHALAVMGDVPAWVLQTLVAVLATIFSLVMSNVGATVLLVPIAMNLAVAAGADPAMFALTVAISTSNSFLIPTHQVNALIMGPGGYKVSDFLRAGGIMTVLFLVVSLLTLNLFF